MFGGVLGCDSRGRHRHNEPEVQQMALDLDEISHIPTWASANRAHRHHQPHPESHSFPEHVPRVMPESLILRRSGYGDTNS
jgi:hypothetical protein